jgi:hypothetical protein
MCGVYMFKVLLNANNGKNQRKLRIYLEAGLVVKAPYVPFPRLDMVWQSTSVGAHHQEVVKQRSEQSRLVAVLQKNQIASSGAGCISYIGPRGTRGRGEDEPAQLGLQQ